MDSKGNSRDAVRACPHDTIASAAGIRVCFDCGEPNPKRPRRAKR